jgi:hypothetical protein
MIVKIQKPIEFINQCDCLVDYNELEKAIIWYSEKPTARLKSIYMYGRYPAVSIYDQKIHIHRLLMMYWLGRDLETEDCIHHIDHNSLNAFRENLIITSQGDHARHHLKGKKQEPKFVKRRIAASIKKRWPAYENPELLEEKK